MYKKETLVLETMQSNDRGINRKRKGIKSEREREREREEGKEEKKTQQWQTNFSCRLLHTTYQMDNHAIFGNFLAHFLTDPDTFASEHVISVKCSERALGRTRRTLLNYSTILNRNKNNLRTRQQINDDVQNFHSNENDVRS